MTQIFQSRSVQVSVIHFECLDCECGLTDPESREIGVCPKCRADIPELVISEDLAIAHGIPFDLSTGKVLIEHAIRP